MCISQRYPPKDIHPPTAYSNSTDTFLRDNLRTGSTVEPYSISTSGGWCVPIFRLELTLCCLQVPEQSRNPPSLLKSNVINLLFHWVFFRCRRRTTPGHSLLPFYPLYCRRNISRTATRIRRPGYS